jgi:hypothetical protein
MIMPTLSKARFRAGPSLPLLVAGALLAPALMLGGCASTPEPVAEMATARSTVNSVEAVDVRQMAPVQLDRAQTKLERAEAALREENYDEARRLAQEAQADAQLAEALTEARIAQRNAEQIEQSIEILRREIERARSIN